MIFFVTLLGFMSSFVLTNYALPIQQTTFYQDQVKVYNTSEEDVWFMSREYDIFASITEHYEGIVDTTFSSESEDLLLNLIHLPTDYKRKILDAQAASLGLEEPLTDKQLLKMPTIIGKHVQAMNAKVYQSIENIITLHWHTIWNPRLLTRSTDQEELIMSFLSSFNGIVAKKLIEEIDSYELLEMVKMDLMNHCILDEGVVSVKSNTIQKKMAILYSTYDFLKNVSALQVDFLRQHVSELRTNLLMELHVQFMDFFTLVQSDILEQLSAYYDQ
ncbi:hypothetical protein BD770DRAFT_364863 [Pilaira anomala]|nr:hypothetical protein BD770DRAFT_364863 [Pilaira anomala]